MENKNLYEMVIELLKINNELEEIDEVLEWLESDDFDNFINNTIEKEMKKFHERIK